MGNSDKNVLVIGLLIGAMAGSFAGAWAAGPLWGTYYKSKWLCDEHGLITYGETSHAEKK